MKYERLNNIVKSGNITIPLYIYKELPSLEIDIETFMFLMFLTNKGNGLPFDVNKLSEEFYCDIKTIMKYIATLQAKKLIEIKVIANEKNIMEEYIYLDFFYEKISMLLVSEINKETKEEKENDEDVFKILEQELGKSLSPIEIEIVKVWKERNYSDELIKEAIKESVMNGVAGLRYTDRILYEWDKKGIRTKEDVEKNKKQFREKEQPKPKKLDILEYEWLDDDEK
jgi:DNA replication protein